MVSEQKLSAVLSEFARTMVTDFPIQAILDRLVERIVDVLPVTAAGVSLISPGHQPTFVAASSSGALQLERLQAALGSGPCVTAYVSGAPVSVPDVRTDVAYPQFGRVAAETGLVAVFAFPLWHNDERLGALDLFCDTSGALGSRDTAAAQTLADVTSAYLLNARARDAAALVAERFRERALHDGLTGLANRVLLQQRLEHAAERARRTHAHAAVLFADLDGFKQVNDTYGHPVGDALLVAVAHRLSALLRPGDTLARVSGDEFVVLCEDVAATADVDRLAERIDRAFDDPFDLPADGVWTGPAQLLAGGTAPGATRGGGRVQVQVTASVGMAYAGRAEDIGHRLMREADTAMYQAKRKGGAAHQVIDLREAGASHDRAELTRDLRAAVRDEQLTVAYQPIVRVADAAVTGVEALVRWTHPQRGPVDPLTMISLAEQSALILDLGAWVLRQACAQHHRLRDAHPSGSLELAVNVSARQLLDRSFPGTVKAALFAADLDPRCLVLEMTEGIFLDDPGRTVAVLAELRALGVRVALDDFGTGYSSLSYLRQYPVDIVKIDRGFVADIGRPSGSAIIGAVTHLAHVLGMSVTAEGVETAAQHEEIARIGCENAQGYHYGAALGLEELSARLAASPLSQLSPLTPVSPLP